MIRVIQKVVGVWLIYYYHFTGLYINLRSPDWLVVINILGSVFGVYIGVRVFREMIPALKGIGMNFLIGVCLFLIDIFYHEV